VTKKNKDKDKENKKDKKKLVVASIQVIIEKPVEDQPTKVKKSYDDEADPKCSWGVICACGRVVARTADGRQVRCDDEVIAKIFDVDANPEEAPDPDDDNLAKKVVVVNNEWVFNEIPNARCENVAPAKSNNKLCVWFKPKNEDPLPVHWPRRFKGVCDTTTEDCTKKAPPVA
jgi:hypothetical protein